MLHARALRALIDELRSRPGIDVLEASLLPGREDIDALLAPTGLMLDPEVRAFYRQVGGLRLDWYAPDTRGSGDEEVAGSISIHSFEEAFSLGRFAGQWVDLLGLASLQDPARRQMEGFFPLDYIRDDDQNAVGWIADGARVTDSLGVYVMSYGGMSPGCGPGSARTTIGDYVRDLLATRGVLSRISPMGRLTPGELPDEPFWPRFQALFG